MSAASTDNPKAIAAPRAAGLAGELVFAVLLIISLELVRLAEPADPFEPGGLTDPDCRNAVRIALNLVTFTGIAFLWFMGVTRPRAPYASERTWSK